MSLLRQLVGIDADAEKLLQPALALARYRVVVKRPRLAPYLDNHQPAYQLIGKANRFDIHVIQ
jgi:16S rRNA (guanine1516-N2)-methyltransferase